MNLTVVLSEASGWLIAALAAITVPLPYLVRGRRLAPRGWGRGFLQRLRPHYWIGYTIAGLSLLHATFAMAGPMRGGGPYQTGIWIATAGMLLAFGQVGLGRRLRDLRGAGRHRMRRWHFGLMAALAVVGAMHVWLNGALIHAVAGRPF
jgi:hypothetical protein